MGRYAYYCEVRHPQVELAPGVYYVIAENDANPRWFPRLNRIISISERVWKQGPKGGVKIIKNNIGYDMYPIGYVTNNEKWMRKFAWAKLRAKKI